MLAVLLGSEVAWEFENLISYSVTILLFEFGYV
jgi:hypothetical protein